MKANEKANAAVHYAAMENNNTNTNKRGPRRSNYHGCLIFKGEGRAWLAKWTVNGHTTYRTTGETDRRKAEKKLDMWTLAYRQDRPEDVIAMLEAQLAILKGKVNKSELPLGEIWNKFTTVEDLSNISEATQRGYRGNVTALADWCKRKGKRNVSDITTELAGEYLKEQRESLGAVSFNCRLVLFKRVWSRLASAGVSIVPDAFSGYVKIKGVKHSSKRRALTSAELKALKNKATDKDMRLLVTLGMFTGMRLSDCALLAWSSVDFSAHVLHVTPIKTKRHGITVTIPLHPELEKELKAAKENATGDFVSERNAKEYTSGHLTDRVSGLFKSCGIVTSEIIDGKKKVLTGFHALRHTFTSTAINSGMSPMLVRQIVGHSSVDMTEAYFHADEDKIREGIKALKVA